MIQRIQNKIRALLFDLGIGIEGQLRDKWAELPASRQNRAFSSDLCKLSDDQLLANWEKHDEETKGVREWYRDRYAPQIPGKAILDIGSGMGIDGIHFARMGGKVTFADIVKENLAVVERVAKAKGLSGEYYFIEDFFKYNFSQKFDMIFAIGSLINAPLDFTKRQIEAIDPWLKTGGLFLFLAYPKERFDSMGARNQRQFGRATDGERTPWVEWYNAEKIKRLFGPKYELKFERNFGQDNIEFNWFELRKVSD